MKAPDASQSDEMWPRSGLRERARPRTRSCLEPQDYEAKLKASAIGMNLKSMCRIIPLYLVLDGDQTGEIE